MHALHQVCVKWGLEVNPSEVSALIFLHGQQVCNEMDPVKEPPTPEHVQHVKDGWAILQDLMRSWGLHHRRGEGRGGHKSRGGRGCWL